MSDVTAAEGNVRVSLDEVRHVAALANLELTAEELPKMAHDLDAVLGFIAQLNEIDTTELSPMAQVAEVLGRQPSLEGESLRQDALKASVDRSLVMQEAPESDGRFFKVPKVIER